MKEQLVLGFDFGTKYIGVAIGQTATLNVRPLTCIKIKDQQINWQMIDQLIQYWQPGQLIVGIPNEFNGKQQDITIKCLKFFGNLQQRYQIPTHKVDEHLSTWEAKKDLSLLKNNYNHKELLKINAVTAALLIKQWFNTK